MAPPHTGIPLFFRRIFPLIFIIVGAVMLAIGGYGLFHAYASQRWPAAKGTIVSSAVVDRGSGSERSFHAAVTYTYTVNGTTYTGDTVAVGEFGTANGARARRIVDRYPPGAAVHVHYNPAAPEVSLLETGIRLQAFLLPGMGTLFIAAGALVLAVFRRMHSKFMVATGYRPRPVDWGSNLAPYYSVLLEDGRMRIVAKRWPPLMTQLISWAIIIPVVVLVIAFILSVPADENRLYAGLIGTAALVLGIAGILMAVYYPNAAAARGPVLLIDRRTGDVEVPPGAAKARMGSVRAVQIVNFKAQRRRINVNDVGGDWLLQHLVLRCEAEEGERYLLVLERGHPMARLGRAIAEELGVPFESASAAVETSASPPAAASITAPATTTSGSGSS